jgi:hypothetical protein
MARQDFINNLRTAARLLEPPLATPEQGARALLLDRAELWLTPKSVADYSLEDFTDWPKAKRAALDEAVRAFLALASTVPPKQPTPKSVSRQARKHLERAIELVRTEVVEDWLEAQNELMADAQRAAAAKGWFSELDQKEMKDSLLGRYRAPRLRIRTLDREVVLDPVTRFGSGGQGIVDLVVLPTYETAYLVMFKDGAWRIVSPRGRMHARRFTPKTLVSTINRLPRK